MQTEHRLIIVGTGIAGCSAALGARAENQSAQITLIGAEPTLPYDRTHLSKQQLTPGARIDDSFLYAEDLFERERITLRTGVRVTRVDPDARTLTLSSDEVMSYDTLVLATGSFVRPLPEYCRELPVDRVHTVRVAEDSDRLRNALMNTKRLVVIGAGLIGLEVASVARTRNIDVSVVDTATRVLMRACDEATSDRVARMHQEQGVKLYLDESVKAVQTNPSGDLSVVLSDGTVLNADQLVVGIGVLPDTDLAEAAGLAVDNGIIVNARGQTSNPYIYAAGDVASLPQSNSSHHIRLETWRHAQDHGQLVGANAVGSCQIYDRPPSFWSDQFDHRIQGVGLITNDAVNTVVRKYENGGQVSFLSGGDETLRAVIGFDCSKDVNAAGRLVGRAIPVPLSKLADTTQPLAPLIKSLLKSAS